MASAVSELIAWEAAILFSLALSILACQRPHAKARITSSHH